MTPSQLAMAQTIDLLTQAGFVPDGQTPQQTVRIPTATSPLLGHSGGQLATLGGRQRFAKPGTALKATVGRQTVALYQVKNGTTLGIASHDTKNLNATRAAIQSLPSNQEG